MSDHTPPDLQVLGRRCADLLSSAVSKADDESRGRLEDVVVRFKIFAGNIGLFAQGRAGVDHRFESDVEARDVFFGMLSGLERWLLRLGPPNAPPSPDTPGLSRAKLEDDDADHQTASESSSEESILEEDNTSSSEESEKDDTFPAVKAIEDLITQLYRFLKLVKTSVSSNEYAKVTNYASKHRDKEEDESFESYIRLMVNQEVPAASASLVERLVNAAMHRRWKMRYKQEHALKLRGNMDELLSPETETKPVELDPPESMPSQVLPVAIPAVLVDPATAPQRRVQFSPLSYTEASTVQKLLVPFPVRSAAPSNVTPSGVIRRDKLDIPPAPRPEKDTVAEVVCPYCTQVIRSDLFGQGQSQRARWASVRLP